MSQHPTSIEHGYTVRIKDMRNKAIGVFYMEPSWAFGIDLIAAKAFLTFVDKKMRSNENEFYGSFFIKIAPFMMVVEDNHGNTIMKKGIDELIYNVVTDEVPKSNEYYGKMHNEIAFAVAI